MLYVHGKIKQAGGMRQIGTGVGDSCMLSLTRVLVKYEEHDIIYEYVPK